MFDVKTLITEDLDEGNKLHETLDMFTESLEEAGHLCHKALQAGGKLVFFGNGGSAADAQHMAAEFVGRFEVERTPLPAIALTTNTSALTAIGNDYSYEQLFERQVQALVRKEDIVIGFSTSGNSENVLKGIEAAKTIGAKTIGFSGGGGSLKDNVDIAFAVPSSRTPRIQEAHVVLAHILTHIVESLYVQS